jgi:hypothetical protein
MENTSALRCILDKSEYLDSISDYHSPKTHYRLNETTVTNFGLSSFLEQERVLQEIVDEVGIWAANGLTKGK